jgi:hypothetical protein
MNCEDRLENSSYSSKYGPKGTVDEISGKIKEIRMF